MYKVVIIDDEALSRIGLRSMLDWEQEGFEIVGEAASGKDGLNLILEMKPDMVISDIVMPGMDGLAMYEEVKKAGLDPIFVALSSYDQFDLVKKAMKMGATDYLLKLSISPETLRELFAISKEKLEERESAYTQLPPQRQASDLASGKSSEQTLTEASMQASMQNREPERTVWETEELRKAYFANLLMGRSPQVDIEKLGIEFDFSCMRILYVVADDERILDKKEEPDARVYVETLRALIDEICQELYRSYTISWYNDFVVLLSDSEGKLDREGVQALADAIILSLREYGNVHSCIGVSELLNDACMISCAFDKLQQKCRGTAEEKYGKTFFCEDAQQGAKNRTEENHIVREAKKYITAHLYENIGLKEISSALYLNPSYLSTVFSKQEECGLIHYINKEKIKEACRLLVAGNMKVYEVSFKLGYDNASYFTKVFRKHTGQSPKRYLEMHQGDKSRGMK